MIIHICNISYIKFAYVHIYIHGSYMICLFIHTWMHIGGVSMQVPTIVHVYTYTYMDTCIRCVYEYTA